MSSSPPALFGTLLREIRGHDSSRLHPGIALRCTPAILAIVAGGLIAGQPAAAAILCGGALTVGAGVYQRLGHSRLGPMLLATLGMGVSAFVGTLAGVAVPAQLVAVVAWGYASGVLQALGGGWQWIGQQSTIALLVASSFPGTVDHALIRAGLVMAGGALQIVTVETLLRFGDLRVAFGDLRQLRRESVTGWRSLRDQMDPRAAYGGFALRIAVVLALAVLTERALAVPNGYWIGMTALLLLRMEFHDTWHRSASRIAGTLAGAGAALLAGRLGAPSWALAAAIPPVAYLCFMVQQFSYALFSFCLTGYIVLLLTYGGLPEPAVADRRVVGTLLGAAFALAGHLHFAARRRAHARSGAAPG